MDDEVLSAREAYRAAFGNEGPYMFGASDRALADALNAAVKAGQPIPNDFDWYPDLPDGAVA